MDWQSDPYVNQQPNFYNLKEDWGSIRLQPCADVCVQQLVPAAFRTQ